jgi:hypothetical protein
MYVTDELKDKNSLSKKLSSVIYELSVNPSIINISIDLQTVKVYIKKIIHFIPSIYSLVNIIYYCL